MYIIYTPIHIHNSNQLLHIWYGKFKIQEWPINLPNQDLSRISKIENPWKSNIPPELSLSETWTTEQHKHPAISWMLPHLILTRVQSKQLSRDFDFISMLGILMNMGPNPWGHRAVEWTGAHMGWDMPMGLTRGLDDWSGHVGTIFPNRNRKGASYDITPTFGHLKTIFHWIYMDYQNPLLKTLVLVLECAGSSMICSYVILTKINFPLNPH